MIALPWLRIARVAAPLIVLAMLVAALVCTRSILDSTRVQRDAAIADVVEFRRLATDATVAPGADGTRTLLSAGDAKAALTGAFRDRDDARATLRTVDRTTKAAKVHSDATDAALARAQAVNARAFERAAPAIARLNQAKPSGDAATDNAAIERDSRAAWEAWK